MVKNNKFSEVELSELLEYINECCESKYGNIEIAPNDFNSLEEVVTVDGNIFKFSEKDLIKFLSSNGIRIIDGTYIDYFNMIHERITNFTKYNISSEGKFFNSLKPKECTNHDRICRYLDGGLVPGICDYCK